jgi:hypothetical protein
MVAAVEAVWALTVVVVAVVHRWLSVEQGG